MNIVKTGIYVALLLTVGLFTACKEQESNTKLVLNEVLITNESNFQDDYGQHGAWIEIFNRSFGSADLAAWRLRMSSTPGDTVEYFIPKGDVLTKVPPRQHALFWADGEKTRGTFHTNFTLNPAAKNWIGLYDSGRKLMDEITIPAGLLQPNQSFGRKMDGVGNGAEAWEVMDGSTDKYVTPSTNNKTIETNAKMEKFELHDPEGIGMTISAMSVVFIGLILLYIAFKLVGNASVSLSRRNAMRSKGTTDVQEAKSNQLGEAPGEVFAAIAMAMHEFQNDVHDVEDTVLTMTRVKRTYSPWSSKIYTLRELPHKEPAHHEGHHEVHTPKK
ncbi:MAG: OadG family protein [Prevotellaceae bacterium]|jgi:Na+-transporting methylmalonyl-CoA/oxaloacetate decarboxylase gamma subunit|nr:OadG family protein [Prevotellaceae bacterium]